MILHNMNYLVPDKRQCLTKSDCSSIRQLSSHHEYHNSNLSPIPDITCQINNKKKLIYFVNATFVCKKYNKFK